MTENTLRFHEDNRGKKLKQILTIFILVFIGALVLFEIVLNYQREKGEQVTDAPNLPLISFTVQGCKVNEIHGCIEKMDMAHVDAPFLPVEGNSIDFNIENKGEKIKSLNYELYTENGGRSIEKNSGSLSSGSNTGKITLKNAPGSEGSDLLRIKLSTEKRDIYYYINVIKAKSSNVKTCMDYVTAIRTAVLKKDLGALAMMEPSDNENDLSNVNIKSSMDLITWKKMDIKENGDVSVVINDYINDIMEITYNYKVAAGKKEYLVKEYFKVKCGNRMYLDDYQRSAEEIISAGNADLTNYGIDLGIQKSDMIFDGTETGKTAAFVNAGKLFEYNQSTGSICKIFDFGNGELNQDHGIKILSLDEDGSLSFVVYGYMSSGTHEGKNGIALYRYNSANNESTEQFFAVSRLSYETLKNEYSKTMYRSGSGNLNIMIGGDLFQINARDKIKKNISGLTQKSYKLSDSMRYISWIDGDGKAAKINMMDLETGKKYEIDGKGNELVPLLYLGEDFVYGKASGEAVKSADGSIVIPMNSIVIMSISRGKVETEKEYNSTDLPIISATAENNTLYLKKGTISDGVYTESGQDVIKNTYENTDKISLTAFTTDDRGEIKHLNMTDLSSIHKRDVSIADIRMTSSDSEMSLPSDKLLNDFFEIKGGSILNRYGDIVSAVKKAKEDDASVYREGKRIWSSSKDDYCDKLTAGSQDLEKIKSETGSSLIDLTGLGLRDVLYYPSIGKCVYTRTENGEYLIVGYTPISVNLYDQARGSYEEMMINTFSRQTEDAGNVFKTLID